MSHKPLEGCHVLIIEDDFYQAQDVRGALVEAGAVIVDCRATIPDIAELLSFQRLDIALLDINLGAAQSFDLARALLARAIPIVFLTGYSPEFVPRDLASAPVIMKPADVSMVIEALCGRLQVEAPAPPGT